MKRNDLVSLASCTSKSLEEAKKLRPMHVLAEFMLKKLKKRTAEIEQLVDETVNDARKQLLQYVGKETSSQVTDDDIKAFVDDARKVLVSARSSDFEQVCKAVFFIDCATRDSTDKAHYFEENNVVLLTEEQLQEIEQNFDESVNLDRKGLDKVYKDQNLNPPKPQERDNTIDYQQIPSCHGQISSPSLFSTTNADHGTSRSLRRRFVTTSSQSPLITEEDDVTIVKTSTSPNQVTNTKFTPSLHKYAVLHNRSRSKQQSDDEETQQITVCSSSTPSAATDPP